MHPHKALELVLVATSLSRWVHYRRNVDGHPVTTHVNLALKEFAPDPERPILIRIRIHFRIPRTNGQCHQDETHTLFAIKAALNEEMESRLNALEAGRVTRSGYRDFYYYAASFDGLSEIVGYVLYEFRGYRDEIAQADNSTWDFYENVLLPRPSQLQGIQNRTVIEYLIQNGDDGLSERPIEHFSYFSTREDRTLFTETIRNLGFGVTTGGLTRGEIRELPFGVRYLRIDRPIPDTIDLITVKLDDLSRAFRGQYDGWEKVICPKKPDLSVEGPDILEAPQM